MIFLFQILFIFHIYVSVIQIFILRYIPHMFDPQVNNISLH